MDGRQPLAGKIKEQLETNGPQWQRAVEKAAIAGRGKC